VHCFVVRAHGVRALAGTNRELDRIAGAANVRGRRKMVCQLSGVSVDVVVVVGLDGFGDALVQVRTPRGTETVQEDLADERVVEPQDCTFRRRRLDEHARAPGYVDGGEQITLGEAADPSEYAELDRAADDRAGLQHPPRGHTQARKVRIDQLGEPTR
jgi:hypothetical protein